METGSLTFLAAGAAARRVHALQLEINASLLITTTREEFIAQVTRGEIPEKAAENIARIRWCLGEVLAALPASVVTARGA